MSSNSVCKPAVLSVMPSHVYLIEADPNRPVLSSKRMFLVGELVVYPLLVHSCPWIYSYLVFKIYKFPRIWISVNSFILLRKISMLNINMCYNYHILGFLISKEHSEFYFIGIFQGLRKFNYLYVKTSLLIYGDKI